MRSPAVYKQRWKLAGILLAALVGCGDAPVPEPLGDDLPPGATTDLAAIAADEAVSLAWMNPSDADYKLTLIVRYAGTNSYGVPTDGADYKVGDLLGSGEVLYVGDGTSFTDSSLDACKENIYQVWTQDRSGNWCDVPQVATVAEGLLVALPTGAPSSASAALGEFEINVAWTNPDAETGFAQARVVRERDGAPAGPDDGSLVYMGPAAAAADDLSLLDPDTTYHYGVYACNRCGHCETSGAGATVTTPAVIPLSVRPTDLAATFEQADVRLTWTNPSAESDFVEARLLRQLGSPPTGPDDAAATLVYVGPAATAKHVTVQLMPDTATTPRTYHYTVYGCKAGGACESLGSTTALTPTITDCLRGGGYTIHWRHASADVCSDNTALGYASTTASPNWWKSCSTDCGGAATARQLNNTGLVEAASIGNDFATRGIPVGRVISSEFCRNFTTAQLMDFGPAVEQSPSLTYFVYDDILNRCDASMGLIAEVPAPGMNTALIGHAGFTCPILDLLAWSEGAIFRPDGQGGAEHIANVPVGGWLGLP